MICEQCRNKIQIKRTLVNLFKINTHHICEYCITKYPIIVNHQTIPTKYFQIDWYSLISETDEINGMAYMSFIKPFYLDYYKNHQNSIFLYFDQISENLITILDSLEWQNIYLVSLYDQIK